MDYKFKTIYYQEMQKEIVLQTLDEIRSLKGKPVLAKE